jgi:hypothetical protein
MTKDMLEIEGKDPQELSMLSSGHSVPGWATYRRDPDQTALWPSFIELLPRTFCFLFGLAITERVWICALRYSVEVVTA